MAGDKGRGEGVGAGELVEVAGGKAGMAWLAKVPEEFVPGDEDQAELAEIRVIARSSSALALDGLLGRNKIIPVDAHL